MRTFVLLSLCLTACSDKAALQQKDQRIEELQQKLKVAEQKEVELRQEIKQDKEPKYDLASLCAKADSKAHSTTIEDQMKRVTAEHSTLVPLFEPTKLADKLAPKLPKSSQPFALDAFCVFQKAASFKIGTSSFNSANGFYAAAGKPTIIKGTVTNVIRAVDGVRATLKMIPNGFMTVMLPHGFEVEKGSTIDALGYVGIWRQGLAQFPALAGVAVLPADSAAQLLTP